LPKLLDIHYVILIETVQRRALARYEGWDVPTCWMGLIRWTGATLTGSTPPTTHNIMGDSGNRTRVCWVKVPAAPYAVVTPAIRLRFDCNSTALRPFDDYFTIGLLCCGLNKW